MVNVARVIGPTIGPTIAAVLAATIGIGWCFIINAVSFGFVIVSLLSLDIRRLHPVPPVRRSRGQLRAGLRYAAAVPDIARPLLVYPPQSNRGRRHRQRGLARHRPAHASLPISIDRLL